MTFTEEEQQGHRAAFVNECRQKAWGALCHADWIAKSLDDVMGHYTKLQEEDRALQTAIKDSENAIDYHTVQNREKRREMQERRNAIKEQLEALANNIRPGQQSLASLHQSAESNLQLAVHAEK